MSKELEQAASTASEATGLDVQVQASPILGLSDVLVFGPIDGPDGEMPLVSAEALTERAALAYLEGLEAGARVANVRHEPLKEAAWHAADMQDADELGNLPYNSFVFARLAALANAVAELDTNTEG